MAHNGRLLLLLLLFVWFYSSGTTATTISPPCNSCQPQPMDFILSASPGEKTQICCLNVSGENCQQSLGNSMKIFNLALLQVLDLSRCNLQNLSIIPHFPSLRKIYLTDNNLSTIPESFLDKVPSLREIYLGDNNLKRLPRSLTSRSLATLDVRGNWIECDCALYESLVESIPSSSLSSSSSWLQSYIITCASPESARNRSLSDVSREDVCRTHTVLYASLGTVVVFLVITALYLGCKRHLDPLCTSCFYHCPCSSCPCCVRFCRGHKSDFNSRIQEADHSSYVYRPSPRQESGGLGDGGGLGNAELIGQSPYENWPLAQVSSSSMAVLSAEASAAVPGHGGSRPDLSAVVTGFDQRAGLLQIGTAPSDAEYDNSPMPKASREHAVVTAEAVVEEEVMMGHHVGGHDDDDEDNSIYVNQPAPVHYYSLVPPVHMSDDDGGSEQETKRQGKARKP